MEMAYRTVDLDIGKGAARTAIMSYVNGLRTRTGGSTIEFISPAGYHVASLSDSTLSEGETGSRLKYRVSWLPLWGANARRTSNDIRQAMNAHRVDA